MILFTLDERICCLFILVSDFFFLILLLFLTVWTSLQVTAVVLLGVAWLWPNVKINKINKYAYKLNVQLLYF